MFTFRTAFMLNHPCFNDIRSFLVYNYISIYQIPLICIYYVNTYIYIYYGFGQV